MSMTLDQAIEILTIHNGHNPAYTDQDRRHAIKLGIEALKREREYRPKGKPSFYDKLPGETIHH